MNNNFSIDEAKDIYVEMDLSVKEDGFNFLSGISTALAKAESELLETEKLLKETKETVKKLTPDCDKLDYALAASSGVLCGVIDVFLVGKPGESPLGNITDKWLENRTKDFAKLCGWNSKDNSSASSAIKFLEKKFIVLFDN